MQVRPRLARLDSTRVLVLVDGERLNNARTAPTGRHGGGPHRSQHGRRLEVASGAGSCCTAPTRCRDDQHPHAPAAIQRRAQVHLRLRRILQLERERRRGAVTLAPPPARRVPGDGGAKPTTTTARRGGEHEDTRPFYTSGRITNADTIDDTSDSTSTRFPTPSTRLRAHVERRTTSGASGRSLNASTLVRFPAHRRCR